MRLHIRTFMFRNIILILFTGLLTFFILSCKERNEIYPPVSWVNYFFEKENVPSRPISALLIENDHTEWFGSQGMQGLVHSDGYEWSVLDQDNSIIPFDSVTCILRDGNGLLWVSWKNGLASFDGSSWKNIPEMSGKRVTSLVVQGIGIIWAGIDGDQQTGGLARFKDGEWKFYNTATTGIPSSQIISMAIDHDQRLWIGSADKGITCYNGLEWTEYNPENTGFISARINAITIDPDGNAWAGTSASELILFTTTNPVILSTGTGKPVTSVVTDKNGMLWVGTAGAGILTYQAGKWKSYTKENSFLPGDSILIMASHPHGNVVASYPDGHLIHFK